MLRHKDRNGRNERIVGLCWPVHNGNDDTFEHRLSTHA